MTYLRSEAPLSLEEHVERYLELFHWQHNAGMLHPQSSSNFPRLAHDQNFDDSVLVTTFTSIIFAASLIAFLDQLPVRA